MEKYLPGIGRADEFRPQELVQRGAQPKPSNWQPQPQVGFDWNNDGRADELRYDQASQTVIVDWQNGRLEVTGVQTNPAVSDQRGSLAIVLDVTGDGRLDLIVANREGNFANAGVLTGDAGATGSRAVAFPDIASGGTGWLNPPKTGQIGVSANNKPVIRELPGGNAILRPVWDLTGDGIQDFVLDNPDSRSTGASFYYGGKPCL